MVVSVPIAIGKLTNSHALRTRCVDKFSVSNVDANMGKSSGLCVLEEDQITGLQIATGNGVAVLVLGQNRAI